MLRLTLFRAPLAPDGQPKAIAALKSRLGAQFQPLLRPALEAPATALGVSAEDLRRKERNRSAPFIRW
jgi:hypothetical protein